MAWVGPTNKLKLFLAKDDSLYLPFFCCMLLQLISFIDTPFGLGISISQKGVWRIWRLIYLLEEWIDVHGGLEPCLVWKPWTDVLTNLLKLMWRYLSFKKDTLQGPTSIWNLCYLSGLQLFRHIRGDLSRKWNWILEFLFVVLLVRMQLVCSDKVVQAVHDHCYGDIKTSTKINNWEIVSLELRDLYKCEFSVLWYMEQRKS